MHASQNNLRKLLPPLPQIFAKQSAESRQIPMVTSVVIQSPEPIEVPTATSVVMQAVAVVPTAPMIEELLSRNEAENEELRRDNFQLRARRTESLLAYQNLEMVCATQASENDNLRAQILKYNMRLEQEKKKNEASSGQILKCNVRLEQEQKKNEASIIELKKKLHNMYARHNEMYDSQRALELEKNQLIQKNHALQAECDEQGKVFSRMETELESALGLFGTRLDKDQTTIFTLQKRVCYLYAQNYNRLKNNKLS